MYCDVFLIAGILRHIQNMFLNIIIIIICNVFICHIRVWSVYALHYQRIDTHANRI